MALQCALLDMNSAEGTLTRPEPTMSENRSLLPLRGDAVDVGGSAIRAIRLHCQQCAEEPIAGVRNCEFTDCHLYPLRFGIRPGTARSRGESVGNSNPTVLPSIRRFCLHECMAGQSNEVRLCPSADCKLYPYRFGCSPEAAAKRGQGVREEVR